MVVTRRPEASNTDTVCVYIMFWANTWPSCEATTDLGDMLPVMRRTRCMLVWAAGIADGAVVGLVGVVVGLGLEVGEMVWPAAAARGSSPPPASRDTAKETSTT